EFHETHGHFEDAEPLYQRSLAVREKVLGPEHPVVATTLKWVGLLGFLSEAEPLYSGPIRIWEAVLGSGQVATGLNNRAGLVKRKVRTNAIFLETA
ncbi:unnamed protein product, partial [Discosporangium mesarthrocarpum]